MPFCDLIANLRTGASQPLRYEPPKKSTEWVEMNILYFAVCWPKFTKFGVRVGEWLQFSTPFSDRRYLVSVWRYSRSNREIRNFDVFGQSNFSGEGPPNFWLNFKNYSQHRTCGKVWWRSAQRPPRLDGEKNKVSKRIETSAVKYNGCRPASWRKAIIIIIIIIIIIR